MTNKFQAGDVVRKIKAHKAVRVIVRVGDNGYTVRTKKAPMGKEFYLGLSYVHCTYELCPIENSPLVKALR